MSKGGQGIISLAALRISRLSCGRTRPSGPATSRQRRGFRQLSATSMAKTRALLGAPAGPDGLLGRTTAGEPFPDDELAYADSVPEDLQVAHAVQAQMLVARYLLDREPCFRRPDVLHRLALDTRAVQLQLV